MTEILDLPDAELKHFADLGAPMSEEEIHFLFDMALKGASDIPRAQDPRLVLEVLLLRMASAPRILDLQSLLGAAPQPRGDLRPGQTQGDLRSHEPARKLSIRPVEIQKTLKTEVEKIAAEKPAPAAPPVPEKPKLASVSEGKTPQERWLNFVELVRAQDAFFAAKIENLIFAGESGKTLKLGIPPKLAFLKDQMADAEIRRKFKGYVDSLWGQGYSLEVSAGREAPAGETAQSLASKKRDALEDEIRARIADHPMVKAAAAALQGEIKSVTPLKQGAAK